MKLKTTLLTAGLALFSLNLSADTVDNAEIVTFVAGDPACAADVNQTIQELVSAVNDNAAQIAALKATPTLLSIISDSSYTIYSVGAGLGQDASANTPAQYSGVISHSIFGEEAVYTLNADGSLDATFSYTERSTSVDHFVVPGGETGNDSHQTVVYDSAADSGSGTDTGTWSLSRNTLTVHLDGDDLSFIVSPDGNMLLAGGVEDNEINPSLADLQATELVVGIRTVDTHLVVTESEGEPLNAEHHISNGTTVSYATYEIHNLGTTNLVISSIQAENLTLSSITPSTLLPDESAEFDCVASDSGQPSKLTIYTNDLTAPVFTLNLQLAE